MKICSFLWVYYGYPTSAYEGVNVEEMRYRCGSMLAKRDGDSVHPDIVAGVPVQVLLMQSDMQTNQEFRMQDHLSNTHRHGRDHLCRPTKVSVT